MDKELLIECFNDTLKMSKSGAFGNSPKLVSKVFNEVIKFMPLFFPDYQTPFKKIVFAIKDDKNKNFTEFFNTFNTHIKII